MRYAGLGRLAKWPFPIPPGFWERRVLKARLYAGKIRWGQHALAGAQINFAAAKIQAMFRGQKFRAHLRSQLTNAGGPVFWIVPTAREFQNRRRFFVDKRSYERANERPEEAEARAHFRILEPLKKRRLVHGNRIWAQGMLKLSFYSQLWTKPLDAAAAAFQAAWRGRRARQGLRKKRWRLVIAPRDLKLRARKLAYLQRKAELERDELIFGPAATAIQRGVKGMLARKYTSELVTSERTGLV